MGESIHATKSDPIFRAKLDGRREDCQGVKPGRDRGRTLRSLPRPGTVDGSPAEAGADGEKPDGSPGRGQGQTARTAVDGGDRRREPRSRQEAYGEESAETGDKRPEPRSKPRADGARPGKPGDGRWEPRLSPERTESKKLTKNSKKSPKNFDAEWDWGRLPGHG